MQHVAHIRLVLGPTSAPIPPHSTKFRMPCPNWTPTWAQVGQVEPVTYAQVGPKWAHVRSKPKAKPARPAAFSPSYPLGVGGSRRQATRIKTLETKKTRVPTTATITKGGTTGNWKEQPKSGNHGEGQDVEARRQRQI